jgi:hypothetical protein
VVFGFPVAAKSMTIELPGGKYEFRVSKPAVKFASVPFPKFPDPLYPVAYKFPILSSTYTANLVESTGDEDHFILGVVIEGVPTFASIAPWNAYVPTFPILSVKVVCVYRLTILPNAVVFPQNLILPLLRIA